MQSPGQLHSCSTVLFFNQVSSTHEKLLSALRGKSPRQERGGAVTRFCRRKRFTVTTAPQSHLCNGASRLTFLKILLFQRTNILTLQQRSKKHGWVNPEYLKVELNNCFPHSWGGGCKKPQVGWHSFGAEMTPRLCKAYIPAVPSFAVIIDHY